MEKFFAPIGGICTFGTYPVQENLSDIQADMAVLGVPYDCGEAWAAGSKLGPQRIREASSFMNPTIDGCYDFEKDKVFLGSDCTVVDAGNVELIPADVKKNMSHIEETVRTIAEQDVIPVILGGDHSITVPCLKALDKQEDITVIHIGAHLDWEPSKSKDCFCNKNTMYEISKMKHISHMVQIGIRSIESGTKQEFEAARAYGSTIISAKQARLAGVEGVLAQIPDSSAYYITIDAAGFDCSVAAGTGRPVPGGLDFYFVNELLEKIAGKGKIAGFDVAEVAPICDQTGFTERLMCVITINLMGNILAVKKEGKEK